MNEVAELPEDLKSKFHLIAGTFIAGKIFSEYAFLLKDCFNHKKKGDTTAFNRTVEAEARVIKCINVLSDQLKSIGCDLGITETEIEGLEETLYAHLQLDEIDQKRVMNLINKIKHDKSKTTK
jgi:hypothetical protein